MKRATLLLFVFCVFFFNSCNLKEITFTEIDNVNITSFNKEGIEAIISAKIKNPNGISFTIYQSNMNVNISGIDVGTASLMDKIRIKRKSEEVYQFKIKSDFSTLNVFDLPKLLQILFSDKLDISIKGNIKAGKVFITKRVPVNITTEVPLVKK